MKKITVPEEVEDLKASEEKYREVFKNACDMISINLMRDDGLSSNFIDVNKAGIDRLGYSYEDFLDMTPADIVVPDKQLEMSNNDLNLNNKGYVKFEIIHQAKNGKRIPVEVNKHLFELGGKTVGFAISRDITDSKSNEIQLLKDLKEKDMLLKEIHHRVKNNFMIISSLLSLQSKFIEDEKYQELFKESQNRVRSMAIIHERFCKSSDLKKIDFGDYIRTLANDLYNTYVIDTSLIKLNIDVNDVQLDINTSIPLGLIVNELITNSLKHAFPQDLCGEINVKFHKQDKKYLLEVDDDGTGFPKDINYNNTDSLGLKLVTSLTEQIDGEIEFNNISGTSFKIIVKEEKFDEN